MVSVIIICRDTGFAKGNQGSSICFRTDAVELGRVTVPILDVTVDRPSHDRPADIPALPPFDIIAINTGIRCR